MNLIELLQELISTKDNLEGTIEDIEDILEGWEFETLEPNVFDIIENEISEAQELIDKLNGKLDETLLKEIEEILDDIEATLSSSEICNVREFDLASRAEDIFRNIEEEEGYEEENDYLERAHEIAEEEFREIATDVHNQLEILKEEIEKFVSSIDDLIE